MVYWDVEDAVPYSSHKQAVERPETYRYYKGKRAQQAKRVCGQADASLPSSDLKLIVFTKVSERSKRIVDASGGDPARPLDMERYI